MSRLVVFVSQCLLMCPSCCLAPSTTTHHTRALGARRAPASACIGVANHEGPVGVCVLVKNERTTAKQRPPELGYDETETAHAPRKKKNERNKQHHALTNGGIGIGALVRTHQASSQLRIATIRHGLKVSFSFCLVLVISASHFRARVDLPKKSSTSSPAQINETERNPQLPP